MSPPPHPEADEGGYPPPGAIVGGKYRVEQSLGKGGMGLVVRATHLQLGEAVALKFLHRDLVMEPSHVERFLREARAAVRIKSEHVARVLDVGVVPNGQPFIVMELLVGSDLHRAIRERGRLPVREAVEYVVQACRAIAEAHRLGIVHRDLKPANLFLTRRSDGSPLVKVVDFGISKFIEASDQTLTATGDVLGSPIYMSPEQIRDSRKVDARSDLWALGCILYTLLAGEAPFAADTAPGTLARIIADPVPPLRAERPDVPPALEAVLLRCLEKSPAQRFQRVEEFAGALESALGAATPNPPAQPITMGETAYLAAPPATPGGVEATGIGVTRASARDPTARRIATAILAIVVLSLGGVLAAALVWQARRVAAAEVPSSVAVVRPPPREPPAPVPPPAPAPETATAPTASVAATPPAIPTSVASTRGAERGEPVTHRAPPAPGGSRAVAAPKPKPVVLPTYGQD